MRKITQNAADAFVSGRKFASGNTQVDAYTADDKTVARMYLHGNQIAYKCNGELLVTLAGWPTPTTRERLNGLLETIGKERSFHQQNYSQFYGSELIDAHQWLKV